MLGRPLACAAAAGALLLTALGGVAHAAPDGLTATVAESVADTFDPLPSVPVGPIGDYPTDIAVAPDGRRALVVSDGYLAQLDVTSDKPRVTARNEAVRGSDVAYQSRTTAYVIDDEQLTVVDTSGPTPRPVRAIQGITPSRANAITVSRDGRWAYVAFGSLGGDFGVRVLSLAAPRQPVRRATIATDPQPVDVDVSPDGRRLVTTHALDDYVGLFDVSTPARPKAVVKRFRVPFAPGAAVFSPNGSTVYVWGEDEAKVGTIDWQRRVVTRTRTVGPGEGGPDVVLSPDGRYLYAVVNEDDESVGAVVVDTRALTSTTFTGLSYSRGLATSPGCDPGRTFFLSSGSNVFDTRSTVHPLQRRG